jgi:hypothetical protein
VSDPVEQPVHGISPNDTGICQSCARDDDDLVAVQRVYVVPESWDTQGSVTTVDEIELWCFACRSMCPHEVVEQA